MECMARCRRAAPGTGGRGGFTLVELVVVVIVAAIVAGIAIPVVNVSRFRTDTAVLEVSSLLRAAQRVAVLHGHAVVVALDLEGRRLRLHLDRNNDFVLQSDEHVRYLELTEGVVFGQGGAPSRDLGQGPTSFTRTQDGLPAVAFRRNGSTSEEGIVYLTSGRAASTGAFPDDTRAVELSRATGRVACLRFVDPEWMEGC